MKRRDFLVGSTIGSGLAVDSILSGAVPQPPDQESTGSRTAWTDDGGLTTPRLFFSKADLPQLRRAGAGLKQTHWERVRQAADRDLQMPPLQPDTNSEWAIRELCTIDRELLVKRCAFAYLITGDQRYQRRAQVEVDATLAWKPWIDVSKLRGRRKAYGLMNGTISSMMAFYLDWCGAALSSEARAEIVNNFKAKAAKPLLQDMDGHVGFFRTIVNNHIPWMVSGAGLMALLLLEDDPFYAELLEKCVYHLRRFLDWINPDGSTDEGGRYWMLGMRPAVQLMDALRVNADRLPARLKWELAGSLYQHKSATSDGSPLSKTVTFPMYCIQRTHCTVDFGDTPAMDAGPMQSLFYWFARIWRNGHYQWQGDQVSDSDPMGCVWYDPTLPAKAPDDLPPSKAFHGAGWGILRSDLTDPNGLLLAIRAGDNAKSHRHYDLGTFILRAFGRGLIIDSGLPEYSVQYWSGQKNYKRSTLGHNCVLVDGKGQKRGAQNRAEITRLQDFGDTKYLAVDVHCPSNEIKLHRRQFAVDLTNPRRIGVTLEDEVHLAERADVMWTFHFEDKARVEGDLISITSGPVRLNLKVSSPSPLRISVERDHPVPFVSLTTDRPGNVFALTLHGDIEH